MKCTERLVVVLLVLSDERILMINQMMPDPKPPRACVFVKGLPAGASVEMEMVAAVK